MNPTEPRQVLDRTGIGFAVRRVLLTLGGKTRSRSERGRIEVVGLVREMMRVTAVHLASCGEGYGRAG
jgi:hypothetical protein